MSHWLPLGKQWPPVCWYALHGSNYGFQPIFNCLAVNLMIDIDECSENRDNCGQLCQNTPGSYSCSCRTGYRVASDGAACEGIDLILLKNLRFFYYNNHIDVDECTEDTDGCAQTCTNSIGSYTCSCASGYRLTNNSLGCNGQYTILPLSIHSVILTFT